MVSFYCIYQEGEVFIVKGGGRFDSMERGGGCINVLKLFLKVVYHHGYIGRFFVLRLNLD